MVPEDWEGTANTLLMDLQGGYDGKRLALDDRLDPVLQALAPLAPPADDPALGQTRYWINASPFVALNALRATGEHHGKDRTPDTLGGALARRRYFSAQPKVAFAGGPVSLKAIRRRLTQRQFDDPRVLLAIADGTTFGAPWPTNLVAEDDVEERLEEAARKFMRPPFGYRLHQDRAALVGHPVFSQYRRQFARLGGLAGMVEAYGDPDDAAFVRDNACLVTSRKPSYRIRLGGKDS